MLQFNWTTILTQIHRTASFLFLLYPITVAHVRYDLAISRCFTSVQYGLTAWFGLVVYDINLGATHTTIPSTRGVTIHIFLVSSATDSMGRCVVLFKPCTYSTQTLSLSSCVNQAILRRTYRPPEPPRMPGISPTPSSPRIIHIVTALPL